MKSGVFQIHTEKHITRFEWTLYEHHMIAMRVYSFRTCANNQEVQKKKSEALTCFSRNFFLVGFQIDLDVMCCLIRGFPLESSFEEIKRTIRFIKRKLEEKVLLDIMSKKCPDKII